VVEARKYSGLAVDTLVELTKDNHADSTRFNAATALLDRGYGRPAQSLDLHLSATRAMVDLNRLQKGPVSWRMMIYLTKPAPKRASVMADDDLSDLEIAVLCDLLEGPRANLKARKRAVLDQLVVKELVEPAKDDPARFQLSEKAHHLLAERGVGISGG
jgi:hypothetical protein